MLDGFASFYRASISSPVLWKPLTNFGGTVHIKSNRLCISSLESRVSRRGKLFIKGNLPLRTSEAALGDKIDLKCEVLEVRAKNILRFLLPLGHCFVIEFIFLNAQQTRDLLSVSSCVMNTLYIYTCMRVYVFTL